MRAVRRPRRPARPDARPGRPGLRIAPGRSSGRPRGRDVGLRRRGRFVHRPGLAAPLPRALRLAQSRQRAQVGVRRARAGSLRLLHADRMLDFAERHGAEFRGHALVWHWQLPRWVWSRDPGLAQFGVNETGRPSWTPQALTRTPCAATSGESSATIAAGSGPGTSSTRRWRTTERCARTGSFRRSSAPPTSRGRSGSRIGPIPRPGSPTTTTGSRSRTRSQTGSIGCLAS